jgi:hypothetical protein
LEAAKFPEDLARWQKSARGGDSLAVVNALAVFLRLAEQEWPDRDPQGRLEELSGPFSAVGAEERAAVFIALIEKHAALLSTGELLDALFLPLVDVARSNEVPEDLAKAVRSLLEARELTAANRQVLERLLKGYRWQAHTAYPPPSGSAKIKYSSKPPKGKNSNPRATDFRIIDGVARVAELAKTDRPSAEKLLREIMIRVLLDDRLKSETDWRIQRIVGRGRYSSSFDTRGAETVLVAVDAFDVPREIAAVVADHASTPRTGYSDADRDWRAGKHLAAAGRHREAVDHFRRFLIVNSESGTDDHTGELREVLIRMHRSVGLAAVASNEWEVAVESLRRLVIFAPFEPGHAKALLEEIGEQADAITRASAREVVNRFWRARLVEMPESGTYRYWESQWNERLPE